MDFQQAVLGTCGVIVAYFWYKRSCAFTISDIPGPKNPSWIYGHMWWWQQEEASVVERRILKEHGAVALWRGILGEKRLWIADPKAIHHILQGASSLYEKQFVIRERIAIVMDKGLVWAEGDVHKRQRRAMTPAFGLVEAKALHPCFVSCSNSLVDKWNEIISNGESGKAAIIEVYSWLSKGTLDAVGAGAFGYDFGAVEDSDNKFTKSYSNLVFGAFGRPTKRRIFIVDFLKWAPEGFLAWYSDRDNRPGMGQLRENKIYAHEVAEKLIASKRQELKDGNSQRDVLSLLVKANSALRPDWRLKDEEVFAQVRSILFAGHETTSKTLTLALWELAKKRHIQARLRTEIFETLGRIRTRGDEDFAASDFDSMPYLLAVGKEVLRVYPMATEVMRTSKKDDVVPLSKPFIGVSGKIHTELRVPAGTPIFISSIGYHLNKDVWGPDSDEFRPERWLEMNEKPETSVGVYGNLITFSGGPKSCIGWRFAVVEIHTFLVTLLRQFDFSLPNNGREVRKVRTVGITPVIVGEEHKGPQMPLIVTPLPLGNE